MEKTPIDVSGPSSLQPYRPEIPPETAERGRIEEACGAPAAAIDLGPLAAPHATADPAPEAEAAARRVALAAFLTIPLVGLGVAGLARVGGLVPWLELALAAPVVLGLGWPLLDEPLASLREGRPVADLELGLAGLGATLAFLYSVGVLLARADAAPLFGPAAAATTLALLARLVALRAERLAAAGARAPLPAVAHRVRAGSVPREDEIELARVIPGDRLRVRAGERVPADGRVLIGRSELDESAATGDPAPVARESGAPVLAGTLNGNGSFLMEVERVGEATLLERVARQVREARTTSSRLERRARLARERLVPAVAAGAVLCFALWLKLGAASVGFVAAASVLIAACPLAFALAARLPVLAATSRGAGLGLLVRDGDALELLPRVDTIVFDKTGTLTEGKLRLAQCLPVGGLDEDELIAIAAAAEAGADHAIARAILAAAASRELRGRIQELGAAQDFQALVGKGVRAVIGGRRVAVGNQKLMESQGVFLGVPLLHQADLLRLDEAMTAVFVAVDGRPAGILGFTDPLRPDAPQAIRSLQSANIRVVLLTGDHLTTAHAIARKVGISLTEAETLPADKGAVIRKLRMVSQNDRRVVALVADPRTDAAALAEANLSIAIGAGLDASIRDAGLTLIRRDLMGLVQARNLGQASVRAAQENFWLAIGYHALALPLAAGVLYPLTGTLPGPIAAGAALAAAALVVILSSLRVRAARL